ncbi:hypothetical protein HPULCUR_005521 [Helicostylum pulchrum]|uniref:Uncharacterized protein n=1 Tax=Helicostylum pulchrum TaxID=562976 RepID=A0ABP9XZB0_9FUNG
MKDPCSSSTKRVPPSQSTSVWGYLKRHHNYQTFSSKEFLTLLNCSTPEQAKVEAIRSMNELLKVDDIKAPVKKFASLLLLDDLNILEDFDGKLHWLEKKSEAGLMTSSHNQLQAYYRIGSNVADRVLPNTQDENSCMSPTNISRASSPVIAETLPENIWSLWSDFVNIMQSDHPNTQEINEYSLEKLGIIILGDHIGNKQTRQYYPKTPVIHQQNDGNTL